VTEDPELLTVEQVARLLGVDQSTVRNVAHNEDMEAVLLDGGGLRFRRHVIEALAEEIDER
jgi:excisionase family DNA binding protein